ncbi:hypothetical protein TNCV_4629471 [Trichonephila clavipes]|nr:hypothetical protein TNCV_4629471 [Trichonephila clavipes]
MTKMTPELASQPPNIHTNMRTFSHVRNSLHQLLHMTCLVTSGLKNAKLKLVTITARLTRLQKRKSKKMFLHTGHLTGLSTSLSGVPSYEGDTSLNHLLLTFKFQGFMGVSSCPYTSISSKQLGTQLFSQSIIFLIVNSPMAKLERDIDSCVQIIKGIQEGGSNSL